MLSKALSVVSGMIVIGHGLVHMMGFSVYLGLAEIEGLAYKTTLLGGQWDLGSVGIRWFGGLWLVPVIGFVIGAIGMMTRQNWWKPIMLASALLSLVITTLDFTTAYAGVLVNLLILAGLFAGVLVNVLVLSVFFIAVRMN